MKRISPKTSYREDHYPSAEESGVTRRSMLRIALTGAAGAGAAALGMGVLIENAEARRGRLRGKVARPRYRAFIDLKPDYRFKKTKWGVTGLMVRSYDRPVADFFKQKKEQKAAQRVVRKVLHKFRRSDVSKPKTRYKIRDAVRAALRVHYKKRTKQRRNYLFVQLNWSTATS